MEIREINNFGRTINKFTKLVYLHFEYLSTYPKLMHNQTEIIRLLTSVQSIAYLLYKNKSIIGYILGESMVLNDGRRVYYISYIYVVKKYRRCKFGHNLLNFCISDINKKGIGFVSLTFDTNNEKLMSFYTKHRFVPDPVLTSNDKFKVFTYFM